MISPSAERASYLRLPPDVDPPLPEASGKAAS